MSRKLGTSSIGVNTEGFPLEHRIRSEAPQAGADDHPPLGLNSSWAVEEWGVEQNWLWVKTNGIPFWGRCTTHFRTYFSGDWDVYWGYGILTHGQLLRLRIGTHVLAVNLCVCVYKVGMRLHYTPVDERGTPQTP